jgi:hypothetical protein
MFNLIALLFGSGLGGLSVFNYQKFSDKAGVAETKRLIEKVLLQQEKTNVEIEKLSEKTVEGAFKLEFLKHLTQSVQNSLFYPRSVGSENIPFFLLATACLIISGN